jgi:plant 4alpha-monomethylsterol monooxygenase
MDVLRWLLATYSEPRFFSVVVVTTLVALGTFVVLAVPLTAVMVWGPRWLEPYRIQPRRPDFRRLVTDSCWHLVRNFAVAFLATAAIWPLLRLSAIHDGPPPPAWRIAVEVAAFVLLDDFLFYWAHRWLHESRWLYRHVHRIHHLATTPIALSGNFMHPVEFLVISTLVLVGPVLLGSHVVTLWVWVAVRQWEAAAHHSGLTLPPRLFRRIPLYDGPAHHDFHHSKFIGNYAGFFSWTDRLFGTESKRFREYLETGTSAAAGVEDPDAPAGT